MDKDAELQYLAVQATEWLIIAGFPVVSGYDADGVRVTVDNRGVLITLDEDNDCKRSEMATEMAEFLNRKSFITEVDTDGGSVFVKGTK